MNLSGKTLLPLAPQMLQKQKKSPMDLPQVMTYIIFKKVHTYTELIHTLCRTSLQLSAFTVLYLHLSPHISIPSYNIFPSVPL